LLTTSKAQFQPRGQGPTQSQETEPDLINLPRTSISILGILRTEEERKISPLTPADSFPLVVKADQGLHSTTSLCAIVITVKTVRTHPLLLVARMVPESWRMFATFG